MKLPVKGSIHRDFFSVQLFINTEQPKQLTPILATLWFQLSVPWAGTAGHKIIYRAGTEWKVLQTGAQHIAAASGKYQVWGLRATHTDIQKQ